jgi:hypothetical protein
LANGISDLLRQICLPWSNLSHGSLSDSKIVWGEPSHYNAPGPVSKTLPAKPCILKSWS